MCKSKRACRQALLLLHLRLLLLINIILVADGGGERGIEGRGRGGYWDDRC